MIKDIFGGGQGQIKYEELPTLPELEEPSKGTVFDVEPKSDGVSEESTGGGVFDY